MISVGLYHESLWHYGMQSSIYPVSSENIQHVQMYETVDIVTLVDVSCVRVQVILIEHNVCVSTTLHRCLSVSQKA